MNSTQVTGTVPRRMSEAEFRSLYEGLRAQVPWGPDDRRGALNYITPAEVLAACGQVRLGRTVSLAAPVEDWGTLDNPDTHIDALCHVVFDGQLYNGGARRKGHRDRSSPIASPDLTGRLMG